MRKEQDELKRLVASTVDGMTAEEARNPIYRCLAGTTMKDLFLTFIILFLYRIALGFTVRYLLVPLRVRLRVLREDIGMRARVQATALERLVQAKVIMNRYFKSNISQIQQTAPASAQENLTRKLSNMLESEDKERERIQAITRQHGIFGLLQAAVAFFEARRRKKQEALEASDAVQYEAHGADISMMLDDHTKPLELSAEMKQVSSTNLSPSLPFFLALMKQAFVPTCLRMPNIWARSR